MSFSKTLYPLLSIGSTQKDRKSSKQDLKIVDWDIKHLKTNKQNQPHDFKQRGQIPNGINESCGRKTKRTDPFASMNLVEENQRGLIANSHNESLGRETKRTDP